MVRTQNTKTAARFEGTGQPSMIRSRLYAPFQPDVGSPVSESGVEGSSPFPCFVGGHLCQLRPTRTPKIVCQLKHRGAQAM